MNLFSPGSLTWRMSLVGFCALLLPEPEELRAQGAPVFGQRGILRGAAVDPNDFAGWSVAMDGNTAAVGVVGEDGAANQVSTSGAVYVFSRSGDKWTLQTTLRAAQPDEEDHFGYSLALHGNTLVVGAPYEDSAARAIDGDETDDTAADAGAVYVFVRNGSQWTRQAYLKAANADAGDQFGKSMAIYGDRLLVGAWLEDGNGPASNGDPENNDASDAGAVYSFVRSGSTWTQTDYLKASNAGAGDGFGGSLAFGQEGERFVVGAPFEDSNADGIDGNGSDNSAIESGAAYVFGSLSLPVVEWVQQYYLKAANSDSGDLFGASVAMGFSTIVVGAPWEASVSAANPLDNSWTDSGAVYVFESQTVSPFLAQQAYLKSSHPDPYDNFGTSVAVQGNLIAVGAHGEDGGGRGVNPPHDDANENSGAVYRFQKSAGTWSQISYLKASNAGLNHQFGISLAMSGSSVITGAWREGNTAAPVAGSAYVFSFDGPAAAVQMRAPGSAAFPKTPVKKRSQPKTFVIANTGAEAVEINGVRVGGKDARSFQVTSPFATLEPGQSVAFTATFKPKKKGNRTATFTASTSAGTISLNVSGKAK